MPPPSTQARTNRASFSTTHTTTTRTHHKHPTSTSSSSKHHNPLSLIGIPWRFLHLTPDNGSTLPPVLSDAGRQYMAEDAYRWATQQTAADVVAPILQLTKVDRQPLRLAAYGEEKMGQVEEEEEEDEVEGEKIPPLPEFNPFSDTFAVALSPLGAQHTSTLPATDCSTDPTPPAASTTANNETKEEEEPAKKKRGMVAADLLSHFAQKEVVDEERERTRKRERSKWENTTTASHHGSTSADGTTAADSGGVMVGGLGLEDESNSARQARGVVDAEEEERRRRLSAAAEEEGLTAADMPDMSDFIKLYEDEDEPSYPAIIWRQKERLTEAADVPPAVISELAAIDRERLAALTKRGGGRSRERDGVGSRGGGKRGHERKMRLRFNLGLGKDYEEDDDDNQPTVNKGLKSKQPTTTKNRFPTLTNKPAALHNNRQLTPKPTHTTQAMYGRQWYLPVLQWHTTEEEKERLEQTTADQQQQPSTDGAAGEGDGDAADGYHGEGWREKVLALKAELPQLYCSKAFKAFLLREREKKREGRGGSADSGGSRGGSRGGRRRLPHYLEGVEALDEKKEEEEEKRAIQAAILAITTPRITHSATTTRTQSAASTSGNPGSGLLSPPNEEAAVAGSGVAGEEEREGDLLEYMREVRMRELNLCGLRWIKEREKAMEERERRKKERERRKARAGSGLVGGVVGGGGGSQEAGGAGDDEDEVDLDALFDVPDYPCSLT